MATAIYTSIAKVEDKTNELKVQTNLGPLRENEVWQSRSKPIVTIPYSKCLEATSVEQYRFSPSEQELYVRASDECKDMGRDKWYIIYGRVNTGTITKLPTELPPPPKGFSSLNEINLNDRETYFYGNGFGGWTVNFKCGGVYFDLERVGFVYMAPNQPTVAQDEDVPDVFKDFIASVKCDEPPSVQSSFIQMLVNRLRF